MAYHTDDFLQADKLIQVADTVRAIASGKYTDGEIEAYLGLSSKGRQGRYYRLATEKLGLVINHQNHAELTELGRELLNVTSTEARMEFLARCLTEAPVFNDALRYIRKHQPSDQQIKLWYRSIYPGAPSTADRRMSTLMSYMRESGLIHQEAQKNFLTKYIGAVEKIEVPAAKPLVGSMPPAKAPVFKDATKILTHEADSQKLERASTTHWKLINAKSTELIQLGFKPESNPSIDLFAANTKQLWMYEMKSISHDWTNGMKQIRRAVSQLYEYRYVYGMPEAILSIVTNAEVPKSWKWVTSYLAKDRAIAYEWTSDFVNFHTDALSSALLDAGRSV